MKLLKLLPFVGHCNREQELWVRLLGSASHSFSSLPQLLVERGAAPQAALQSVLILLGKSPGGQKANPQATLDPPHTILISFSSFPFLFPASVLSVYIKGPASGYCLILARELFESGNYAFFVHCMCSGGAK